MAERIIPDHIPFTANEIMKGDVFVTTTVFPDGFERTFWRVTARTPKYVTIVALDAKKVEKDGKWVTYPIDSIRHTKCYPHGIYDEKSGQFIMQCYVKIDPKAAPVLTLDKKKTEHARIYDGGLLECMPD
jgi:hypothetical protein